MVSAFERAVVGKSPERQRGNTCHSNMTKERAALLGVQEFDKLYPIIHGLGLELSTAWYLGAGAALGSGLVCLICSPSYLIGCCWSNPYYYSKPKSRRRSTRGHEEVLVITDKPWIKEREKYFRNM